MNIVKQLRKSKGMTQQELAKALGVSQPTICDWESNKKDPSAENLTKVADFFSVDRMFVLGYDVGSPNVFIPGKPSIVGVSETEQIVQYVLDKLNVQYEQSETAPPTPEIRIVSGMMEKMSKAQQEQVVAVVRAMFNNR